ncbi:MAG: hypothetical protein QOD30_1160 [Actinomycetota bacterium]|nr:hypothetical protein [Actinomycetota bacterium]
MRIRIVLLVGIVLLSACGGGGKSESATTTTEPQSTTVSTFGGTPGAAQRVACQQSVQTLQQASDFYAASHGAPAPSIDQLPVESKPSVNAGYTITYDATTGHVGATGACTVP